MRASVVASVLFLMSCTAFGQSAAGLPAFDVTSVKASQGREGERGLGRGGPGGGRGPMMPFNRRSNIFTEPGSLTMRGVNLAAAIGWAYGVLDFQVSGPAWLTTERFDILAKAGSPAPDDQLKLMTQSLLADRFKLEVHRERKVSQYWVLSVAKGGPKFHDATSEGDPAFIPSPGQMTVTAQRVPVSQFIDLMQNILRAPVVDQTGLKGRYDLKISFGDYATTPIQNDDITTVVLNAVQDLLGLKLDSKKGPVETIVVDHAEKVPTEN